MSGRVALVTGGGGGIGGAIAAELATAGCAVAVADSRLDAAVAVAERVDGAVPVELDVTSRDAVVRGVASAVEALGPVEVLVNAAGWDELRPFLETEEGFWDRVIAINFKGCLHTTHAVLPGMVERGFGRVVNIASDAGRVGSSLESVYAGAKGGVIAFTKTIAREVATKGVTANCVCPGPTRTPMLEGMTAEGGQKLVDALIRAVPMKRLGEPEDVAAAVAYLASDRAGFVTGQTLSVSGGLTMA
ncbi:MAG TPA: SDR family oxidoreductase [Thermoleophilaceae bacterium]|nr:SDR family oxidoreductase [Thermoleophilaceae bacterium]